MKLKNLLTAVFVCTAFFAFAAKDGYNIKVNIKNNNDTMLFLCNYYGDDKLAFKIDSVQFNKGTSTVQFKSTKKIVGGLHTLFFADKSLRVDFILLNGDETEISFDKNDALKTTKYKNSKENTVFQNYQNYMMTIGPKFRTLEDKYKVAKTKKDSTVVLDQSSKLSEDIKQFRKDFVAQNPGTYASKLVMAMMEPDVPKEVPFLEDGKTKDSTFGYRYYMAHYWDNFDWSDNRLVYSPILENKFNGYTSRLDPTPDSVDKYVSLLMSKPKCPDDMYKYTFWTLAKYTGNSKVMGLDNSYVTMLEKYILMNNCEFLDTAKKRAYSEDYYKMALSQLNKKAYPLALPTKDGNVVDVFDVCKKGDYTLVAFFDPDCHHCQEELPRLDSCINSIMLKKKVNIMKYGVQNAQNDEKWVKLIKDKDLSKNWVHVHDPKNERKYVQPYNVYKNPVFYLLDKDGIIVGKRFDHSNLEGLVDFLIKKKKEGKK